MNRAFALLVLASAAIPASALAQSTGAGTVAVGGTVASLCILGNPNPATVDLGQMVTTSGERVGRISTLPSRTVALAGSFCNFAGSVVRVDATALVAADTATPQAGFARAVNYTATASAWATGNAAATTAATANGSSATASGTGSTQPLPKISDIGLTMSNFTVPGDAMMVAGNYSGSIVVTLGPAAVAN